MTLYTPLTGGGRFLAHAPILGKGLFSNNIRILHVICEIIGNRLPALDAHWALADGR